MKAQGTKAQRHEGKGGTEAQKAQRKRVAQRNIYTKAQCREGKGGKQARMHGGKLAPVMIHMEDA